MHVRITNFQKFNFFSTKLGTHHPWVKGLQVCSNEGPGAQEEQASPACRPAIPVVCLSVRPSVRPSVCLLTFDIFDFFSRTTGPNLTKLGTNQPWVKGIQVCSNEGPGPHQRGDNHENAKIGWCHLKIFFSRTTEPEDLTFTGKLSNIM